MTTWNKSLTITLAIAVAALLWPGSSSGAGIVGGGAVTAQSVTANSSTGVISGGEVTVNADPTKFDLAAGTGVIVDWTDRDAPRRTPVAWAEQLAVTPVGLTTHIFTTLTIDSTGTLVQRAEAVLTPEQFRAEIVLQAPVHEGLTTITSITQNNVPAFQNATSAHDYIRIIGSLNSGNGYVANGSNLAVDKVAGVTTFPYINIINNHLDPTNKTDAAQTAMPAMVFNYRDGVGGISTEINQAAIKPDLYDDGTGVLAAVGAGRWQIWRFFFFSQNQGTVVHYGQATYASKAEARSAIFTEDFTPNPLVDRGSHTTALLVEQGTSALNVLADAEFITVSTGLGSSGSFAPNTDPNVDHSGFATAVNDQVTAASSPNQILLDVAGVPTGDPTLHYDGTTLRFTRAQDDDIDGSNGRGIKDNDTSPFLCTGATSGHDGIIFTSSNGFVPKAIYVCNVDGEFRFAILDATGNLILPEGGGLNADATHGENRGKAMGTVGAFNAVTDGSFNITVDGVASDVTGMNFSSDADYDAIIARVQAAIRALGGGLAAVTVTHDGTKSTVKSGTTGITSQVEFLSAAASGTDVSVPAYLRLDSVGGRLTDGTAIGGMFSLDEVEGAAGAWVLRARGDDGVRYETTKIRGTLLCDGTSGCGNWNPLLRLSQYDSAGGTLVDRIYSEWLGPVTLMRGESGADTDGMALQNADGDTALWLRPEASGVNYTEVVFADSATTVNAAYEETVETVCQSSSITSADGTGPPSGDGSRPPMFRWPEYDVELIRLGCFAGWSGDDLDIAIEVCDADGVTSCTASGLAVADCDDTPPADDTTVTAGTVLAGEAATVVMTNDFGNPDMLTVYLCHTKALVQ